jgi:hypothetical protein
MRIIRGAMRDVRVSVSCFFVDMETSGVWNDEDAR